jgi:acyl-CoA synthetase (AMP-forming)/AMP-acid ligase II
VANNIADLFEHAVDAVPERTALIVGDRRLTFADLEADANRFAHYLAAKGIGAGDHVGIYAKNVTEHVIAMLAAYKLRAITINVNFRYVEGELDYIFDNADLKALIFERGYTPLVNVCAPKHELLQHLIAIEDGNDDDLSVSGAVAWADALAGQAAERDFGPRSNDDLYIVYTGGTTGFPKGVMWRHEDVWRTLGGGIDFMTGERYDEWSQSKKALEGPGLIGFPLSPIMHGGAQWGMLQRLFGGETTILVPNFDPQEIWEIVDREGVNMMFMTGDAMARPLIEEFEKGGYKGEGLVAIASSAAIFSRPIKERWMAAFPNTFFTDSVGSSETGFQGVGLLDKENIKGEGALVALGPESVVLDEDNKVVDIASNVGFVGKLARANSVPVGYYKDPEKSAKTFIEIDGKRYSVPGDFVRIEEEGRITLLGRGSNCINTGGEKVYPEEVEMCIKSHPAVFDVLVIGLPDERWGQRVAAVVQFREGASVELDDLNEHLRTQLSGYKVPRTLIPVAEIPRHVTGKANYPRAKELALEGLEA